MVSVITRSESQKFLIGFPYKLAENQLPTNKDVINHCRYLKSEIMLSGRTANRIRDYEYLNIAADDVFSLWNKSSLNTITMSAIRNKVKSCYENGLKIGKKDKKLVSENYISCTNEWLHSLFDICSCQCPMPAEHCSCPLTKKINRLEIPFLIDQRGARKMQLFGVDIKESKKQNERCLREEKRQLYYSNEKTKIKLTNVNTSESSSDDDESADFQNDPSFIPPTCNLMSDSTNFIHNLSLANVVLVAARYGLSSRATASLLTAFLVDMGMVTSEDKSKVIDHHKVYREMKKQGQINLDHMENDRSQSGIQAISFDGRLDETLFEEDILTDNTYKTENPKKMMTRRQLKREEHITVLCEPGSKFLDHFTPTTSKACDISNALMQLINKYALQNDLIAVCGDGCPSNTGKAGGTFRNIEVALGRPLHWMVCQLHGVELLLKRLFMTLDGGTRGPNSYSGALGSLIQNLCPTTSVVNFEPISGKVNLMCTEIYNDLSNDQKYLYEACHIVQTGNQSLYPKLSSKNPGKLNSSRWLTMANRLLRLYMSTSSSSLKLRRLIFFILNVYAPVWFKIRQFSCSTDGPKNVYFASQLLKLLPKEDLDIVWPVFQRNAYFVQVENLLLAMAADSDKNIRQKAVEKIIVARGNEDPVGLTIREFIIPTINIMAKDYSDIIDWDDDELIITEPPALKSLSNDDLLNVINHPFNVPSIPCHTQSIERMVKLVTEVSKKAVGHDNRSKLIISTINDRQKNPSFTSKSMYNV